MADRSRRREEAEVFTEMRGLVFRLLTSAATLSFAVGDGAHHDTAPSNFARRAERRPPARYLWQRFAKGAVPEAGAPGAVLEDAPEVM